MTSAEKKSELLALVAQGENEVVEFKETTGQRVEAWRCWRRDRPKKSWKQQVNL